MLDPIGQLSPLQHHLLRELDLCDLPVPEAGPESYAVRNLDTDAVQDALPTLLGAGLVELVEQRDGDRGTLRLTATGAAALRTAECDELAARLSAVSSFADTVARGTAPRSAGHALRLLAEGTWDLEQAEAHVAAGDGA
ncbi:hypothetical protein HUT15_04885 [Streptomyces sp. NA03103]|uniref:hypothetical protein n=1 Tax=Streptomyces sp. NA03103 TaxID=2742134 RepID=UPI001591C9E0|nr:hypothetical protein [Streptomyces sp. NA03103]QKW59901.1 hypothetical protein HUT15_04885 [Streptomyces sp. NA03103]